MTTTFYVKKKKPSGAIHTSSYSSEDVLIIAIDSPVNPCIMQTKGAIAIKAIAPIIYLA